MDDDLVSAGVFNSETQAYHAVAVLKEAGINATLSEPDDGAFGIALDSSGQIDVVVVATNLDAAKKILAELEFTDEEELAPAWTCACGEEVDEGFAVCWSCGAEYGASGQTTEDSNNDTPGSNTEGDAKDG